jgi:hypothetical protein
MRYPKEAESVSVSLLKSIGKSRKKRIYYLYVQYNLHVLFLAICPTRSGHFLSGFLLNSRKAIIGEPFEQHVLMIL